METPHVGKGKGAGSKATQFKPGWKGGPGRPRGSSEQEPAALVTPLDDMRHVYTNPSSQDKTPNQKRCRQFFDEEYEKFITIYMRMLNAHSTKVAAAATPGEAATPGDKETPVEELIAQLLREWEEEESLNGGR